MAKKKASEETALAPRDPNVALEAWEQELQDDVKRDRESVEDIGGGLFASIRGGKLKIGGNQVPNDTVACVILAHTATKTYFPGSFDPDSGAAPVCYAFGLNHKEMKPHVDVTTAQSLACDNCKHNEFGSANTGKGKACKDGFKLAFVQAGTLQENGVYLPYTNAARDLKLLGSNDVVKMSIPPTSLKAFKDYIDVMGSSHARPLYAVVTKIKVSMGDKEYPVVSFECMGLLSKEQVPVIRNRREQVMSDLVQPYPKAAQNEKGSKGSKSAKAAPKAEKVEKAEKPAGKKARTGADF